jgi:hypothetical protein
MRRSSCMGPSIKTGLFMDDREFFKRVSIKSGVFMD